MENLAQEIGDLLKKYKLSLGAVESATGGRIEYLEALDETLSRAGEAAVCRYLAGALQLGGTRLIDNVDVPPG